MKKKAYTLFLSAVLLGSSLPSAAMASAREITVKFNGNSIPVSPDVSPYIENGITFVPISVLSKMNGLSINWMKDEGTTRLWMDRGGVYTFKPGTAYGDDWSTHYPLGAPLRLKKGTAMLPLRFIAEMAGANVKWNEKLGQVSIFQKRTAIASVPGSRNRLYPVLKEGRLFKGIQLEWDGLLKTYPWVIPTDVSSPTQLFIEDISGDGQAEAVVTINTGRGTGLYLEELHVIDRRTFKEIPVQDPLEIIEKSVESRIDPDGKQSAVTVIIDGERTEQYKERSDFSDNEQHIYSSLWFGAIIRYTVKDSRLTATLAGASGISTFEGDVEITYAYKNGKYVADSILYIPYIPRQ